MSAQAALSAQSLGKTVRDGGQTLTILRDVSLSVHTGEWLVLVGPSGSGKSTLLQILGALDPHYSGEVHFGGTRLTSLTDKALARLRCRSFGFVFQAYNLLSHLTALQNVVLPAYFTPGTAANMPRAAALLDRVGLGDKTHRLPGALSGGERQRVAIARALYSQPSIVFCDEPTGNLDSDTGAAILNLFAELNREGVALVVATHDEAMAQRAHRTLRLQSGTLQ